MATWEDGPEYAPLERPDAFAEPAGRTVGLESPPVPPSPSPTPIERPSFADPAQAVPPLAALVPAPPAARDPEQPFDVVSSLVTAESSAWASAHWAPPSTPAPQAPIVSTPGPRQGGAFGEPGGYGGNPNGIHPDGSNPNGIHPDGGNPNVRPPNGQRMPGGPVPAFPPPTGTPRFPPPSGAGVYPTTYPSSQPSANPPVGNPAGQPFAPSGYPPANGPFPAPGTPQWFGPGSYQPPAPRPAAPTARTVLAAATPGVLVTLVVGAFIWVLAPVTLVIAFLLASRMTYGRKAARTAFAAVLAFLGLVGLLALITADGLFAAWWDTVAGWACFGSWVMLVATVVAVYRAVKQGRPDPPPTPRGSLR